VRASRSGHIDSKPLKSYYHMSICSRAQALLSSGIPPFDPIRKTAFITSWSKMRAAN